MPPVCLSRTRISLSLFEMRSWIFLYLVVMTTVISAQDCTNQCSFERILQNVPIPNRCDQFCKCDATTERGTITQCPMDTLFTAQDEICDHAAKVLREDNRCNLCPSGSSDVSTYAYGSSCDVYYGCSANSLGDVTLAFRCCPSTQAYVAGSGCRPVTDFGVSSCSQQNYTDTRTCRNYFRCDSNGDLLSLCCPDGYMFDRGECRELRSWEEPCSCYGEANTQLPACASLADPNNICNYVQQVHGRNITRPCAKGTAWNSATCGCDDMVNGAATCPGSQPVTTCSNPNLEVIFNTINGKRWGFMSSAGYVQNYNAQVAFDGTRANFANGGSLAIFSFSHNDWTNKYLWARVTFTPVIGSGVQEVLSTCENLPTIQLTVDTTDTTLTAVTAVIRTDSTAASYEVTLQYPVAFGATSHPKLQATIRYARSAEGLQLHVREVSGTFSETSSDTSAQGVINTIRCSSGLLVGGTLGSVRNFRGTVDDLTMFTTCNPPAVDQLI